MNFKEKVQSMTAKEIIESMVEGLRKPRLKINMDSYGEVKSERYFFGIFEKEVCFGCAATNAICVISNSIFDKKNIRAHRDRAKFLNTDDDFLGKFEFAINALRLGNIHEYNKAALIGGLAIIKESHVVPALYSTYKDWQLEEYEKLANMQ
jgi:hypothetical protein